MGHFILFLVNTEVALYPIPTQYRWGTLPHFHSLQMGHFTPFLLLTDGALYPIPTQYRCVTLPYSYSIQMEHFTPFPLLNGPLYPIPTHYRMVTLPHSHSLQMGWTVCPIPVYHLAMTFLLSLNTSPSQPSNSNQKYLTVITNSSRL